MSARGDRGSRRGFTLLEVLLALTLTGIVIGLSGPLAVQTVRTTRRVEQRIVAQINNQYPLDRISADFNARLEEEVGLALDPNGRPTITLFCLASEPTAALHVALLPFAVTYRLVRGDERLLRLLREVRDPTHGDGPLTTEVIAENLIGFQVNVWFQGRWRLLSAGLAERLEEPEAFSVRYEFAGSREAITRTFIVRQLFQAKDHER